MPLERDIDIAGASGNTGALSPSGPASAPVFRVRLRPNRSLTPGGFATFIGITCALLSLPLLALLGTPVLWGILPFLMIAVAGVWIAIRRNWDDGRLTEVLTLWPDRIELLRINPRGPDQHWTANPFWVRLEMHSDKGPVENYITLEGAGRSVELGAFLSPDERAELHHDLARALAALDVNTNR